MDIGLCPFISEDWIQFARKFANGRPNGITDSIEFSNIGKVRLKASGAWEVKDFWFAQCRKDTGAAIIVTVARHGEAGENVRAILSSFPQAVPRESLADIARAWEQELQLVVGDCIY